MSLSHYQGLGQFGRAYQIMLENDAHAPGSVDRVLQARMIRLCSATAAYLYDDYTPTEVRYERGSRPELERCIAAATVGSSSEEERVAAIAKFCAALSSKAADTSLDMLRLGGTEEEIISRGSDWCTDVARVGCALSQVAGFPARLVCLGDTARAYSGHAIVEVYRGGVWGAVDPTTNVIYRYGNGGPASTWRLMCEPRLLEAHSRGSATPYTTVGQFRCATVSNYFVWEWKNYDYTVSGINDYYHSILEMAARGWPGGLRWLHGEDRGVKPQLCTGQKARLD